MPASKRAFPLRKAKPKVSGIFCYPKYMYIIIKQPGRGREITVKTTPLIMAAAYLYGKLSLEQIWGILIGYNKEELQYLSRQTLSQLVRIWDLETGIIIFAANIFRAGLFAFILQQVLPGASMIIWPGLACLLLGAECRSPFWKRWTLLAGSLAVVLPEFFQLLLAFNFSALLLTRRKQWIKHSTLLAGLCYLGTNNNTTFLYPLFALILCSLTVYGWSEISHLVKAGSSLLQERYHAGP